jgi:hypothetical protein
MGFVKATSRMFLALLLSSVAACGEGGGASATGGSSGGTGGSGGRPPTGGNQTGGAGAIQGLDAPVPIVNDAGAGAMDDATGADAAAQDAGGSSEGGMAGGQILNSVRVHGKEKGIHQHARGPVDLGPGPFSNVRLTVELDTTCFPFERSRDDPPPMGQRFPPKCDAYDRRFEILLDPPTKDGDPPGIELVRAMTPFGGPMRFEADITDVLNGRPGPHTLEAYIDTWPQPSGVETGSDGGWFVSAWVAATPGPAPREVLAVIPLYYDSQRIPTVGPLAFTLPPGTTRTRVEYRATGHTLEAGPIDSACNGAPEEFCRRTHTLSLDDQTVDEFVPYRTDCASVCTLVSETIGGSAISYCKENPRGRIASVRAPRANWCPGSVTPPRVLEPALSPGEHQLSWRVSTLQSGGMWRASAVVFAYR